MKMHLGTRLGIAFGLISCIVFLSIGGLSYHNMQQMVLQQQDEALALRISRIEIFLADQQSFQVLIEHPELYENMLGQEDNLLILKNAQNTLIDINPLNITIPLLDYHTRLNYQNNKLEQPTTRLAFKQVDFNGQSYQLIAGKQLAAGQQVLKHYLIKLVIYTLLGIILSTLLAWLMGHYLLRSMRQLIYATQQINVQQLDQRIELPSRTIEVQQLTEAMNAMLDRIQQGYEQLARFSEDISHELRTPLNNLMGQTQIALSKSRSRDELENLLYSHLEEYERLTQMIENMLFIARVEHGHYQIEKQTLELSQIIEDLLAYFEFLAEEKNISIYTDIPAQLNIAAHPEHLQRALANLLSNAVQYGKENGEIRITAMTTENSCRIDVLTAGVQIPEQHLAHLFERFYQVDSSRHQKAQTGGLGLAIVQSIMQLHQGEVQVNNHSQGVVFSLIFPI
ncbi:heavy metal sensor histidine kinase [Acinetobacter sp. GFQ9D192M]|uniref:heavy metal sensor histidine kinase n=1 Tax=unclassified Acinetobacter TaxID=196816 RepID=UPI00140C2B2A|nr:MULTISPECIES: heavy metal sensor histidine kinase [unclassified Acinetobacter]NHB64359.1 heavy metal sensor histidine kinase [Acinetobacter sp. GFQ9D191M]NHB99826.1 heavy metal sensor histidine kinase [Acinetobacter sp. GFQ9D192M]